MKKRERLITRPANIQMRLSLKNFSLVVLFPILLSILFGITELPVAWRWSGWLLCWIVFIFILQAYTAYPDWVKFPIKLLVSVLLVVLFIHIALPYTYFQWREEMAAKPEGDLIGAGMTFDDGKSRGFPAIHVGGGTIYMSPEGTAVAFPFFPDAGVRLEWGKISALFSTTVRDDDGHTVVTVSRNHWIVYPPYFQDKNYTKTALEVKNSAGHVVLQVQILPDGINLQGEWWDVQGGGIRLVRPMVVTKEVGWIAARLGLRNQQNGDPIQPMFEYPSRDHWEELAKPHPPYVP